MIVTALILIVAATCGLDAVSDSNIRTSSEPETAGEEFCHYDTFKGRCWRGEVIVMTRAVWGRMKTGRCVEVHPSFLESHGKDPMFLGCHADVLSVADRKCSGKPECDIKIPDPEFDHIKPCYAGLTMYFEASYRCVRVVQESRSCTVLVNSESQYISTVSTSSDVHTVNCGTSSHPWRVEAAVGQRINISLLDFSHVDGNTQRDRDVTCRQYGYIVEKSNRRNVSLCAATIREGINRQRESAVYTSDANKVDITFTSGTNNQNYNFIINVQAVGCTNMIPPDHAWLRRSENVILIGCYLSQQTWQLKCDGYEWKGHVGTCPETYDGTIATVVDRPSAEAASGIGIMVTIACATVIVCLAVIGIGCCCLKQFQKRTKGTVFHNSMSLKPQPLLTPGDAISDHGCGTQTSACDINGFTRLPIATAPVTEAAFVGPPTSQHCSWNCTSA